LFHRLIQRTKFRSFKEVKEALKDSGKNLQAAKVAEVMLTTGNDKLNDATSHQKATEGEDT